MTSKEFVIWMKGFMEACNDFTATPKQWDRIKEELDKVNDNYNTVSISTSGTGASGVLNITNPNPSFTHKYPDNSTWTYTNGENKKQQLND
jgi:hypothetical protein